MIKIGLTADEGIKPVKGPGGIQRIQDQVYDCNRNFVCVYPAQKSQGGESAPGPIRLSCRRAHHGGAPTLLMGPTVQFGRQTGPTTSF